MSPDMFEKAALRVFLFRWIVEVLKAAHSHRFPPGRRFGADIGLIFVHGATVLLFLEGKPVRVAGVARYLDMPHETVRRHLRTLTKLGLLTRQDHSYEPTARSQKFDYDKITDRLIKGLGLVVYP